MINDGMKLISLNVGIKLDNSTKVWEFIANQKPDIVAFQEIMRHFDDSVLDMYKSKYAIEKIIGKALPLPYSFFGPVYISDHYQKNGIISRDFWGLVEQGNEVMAKFPIIEATDEFFYKSYGYFTDTTNFATEDHARAVTIVELEVNGKRLQILNLHGAYSKDKKDSERSIAQCTYVLNAAKRKDIPTIIVGDFNLFPDTKSIGILDKEFRNLIQEYKITSTRPDFKDEHDVGRNVVDYIFVNGKIKVNGFDVAHTDISDHLPLLLDFDILD